MKPITFGLHGPGRAPADPTSQPNPSHVAMLQDAQRAEQLGFDTIWIPDHYYFQRPWGLETFPEAWTLMTAIAMKTERVRVGTNVIAAGFRHPALLAKMAGALQELSGGRLILGIGAGNQVHEHNAFDVGFERRVGRFKEYMAIMTALMKGETVTLEGRHYTLREASLRTVVPEVPIWVAAGGEQMLELVAKYGSGWNPAGVGGNPDAFTTKYAMLKQACQKVGRNVEDLDVGMMFFIGIEADATAARQAAEALAEENKTTPEQLAQRVTVGTPDQIAEKVRPFVKLGLNHVIFNPSATPHPEHLPDRFELLAKEVFPRIRAQ
jgi:alkanesulfonate monooxygenase SsuD/methylene tetrahydromethanopterin reductase-like flavin-dependent oxidoreductase (luciferase family)